VRRARRRAIVGAVAAVVLVPAVAVGGSLWRTESLRSSFDRQFWRDAPYPGAHLLGSWRGFGRVVITNGAHCDFAAEAVYGTPDDYEAVEAHYAAQVLVVDTAAPLAYDVQPISDRALTAEPLRANDPDVATRDVLIRTQTDLARARSFPTVYVVQAVSWGHPAWLDWRCR
jgi:hypothetical protein